jgi:hypothetical protein
MASARTDETMVKNKKAPRMPVNVFVMVISDPQEQSVLVYCRTSLPIRRVYAGEITIDMPVCHLFLHKKHKGTKV